MPAVALTDHGMAGGLLQLKKECEKNNISWIPGFEAYVAPTDHTLKEKSEGHSKVFYHLTVLAKNYTGLQNLFTLCSLGWTEGYYYRARISDSLLQQYREGLIILSGCAASRLSTYILEDKFTEAKQHIEFMRETFKDDFYIEVQNHGLDFQIPINAGAIALAEKYNIPIVATQDSHYQDPEDAELHNHICKLAAGDLEFDSDQNWFKSRAEMEKMFVGQEDYLDQTLEIANKINVEWDYSRTIWPVYPLPEGRTAEQELRDLSKKGLHKLFLEPTQKYKDRLEEELEVITKMGFSSYFLIVADFANWCRGQGMATSPGRGSAAGSLCCYCIGITEVDPIKYNLLFSRFLNESRISLPDVDYDVDRDRRGELIDYVSNKYGRDKISQIGTYGEFKPRGSLRDFARTCGYDVSVGNRLADLVPADIAGKQLKFQEVLETEPKLKDAEEQDVIRLASKAEGIKKQAGVHAAGVLIADTPINRLLPLFLGKHGEIASQFDMHDVEEIGLVKFDFLGLKNLTIIGETIRLIKENQNIDIDIYKLKDGDKDTYKLFHHGDLDGIFQFETSAGFKELCMDVQPKSIEDLSVITSIFRPGPLDSGLKETYVKRRRGEKFKYDFNQLEPVLSNTFGCLIYQEQIMKACTDIAGYTLPEADNMRRIVGKKKRKEMADEREKFIKGCITFSKINKQIATELFDAIEKFALYGFNKSHGISYSFISYRTAWLKAHYPLEFYTALLNCSLDDTDDLVKYTYSAREREIPLLAPDVNTSGSKFKLDNGAIIFGFSAIKGLGVKACEHLLKVRPKEGFENISELVKAKVNKRTITALAECGALESISNLSRNQIVEHIPDLIEYHKKLDNWKEMKLKREIRDKEIAEAVKKGIKPPRKLSKLKDKPILKELEEAKILTKRERLAMEKKTLGIYLTGHPLDEYSKVLEMAKYTINDIKQGKVENNSIVKIPIVILSVTKKLSKKKQSYGITTIEDHTGRLEATIFSRAWKKLNNILEEEGVYIITGRVNTKLQDDGPPIINISINDAIPVEPTKELTNISIKLKDGTVVNFLPNKESNTSKWQEALAYVKNMQRMM